MAKKENNSTPAESDTNEKFITIADEKFSLENPSEEGRKALNTLRFTERKLVELQGEISMANIARVGLLNILKRELKKI